MSIEQISLFNMRQPVCSKEQQQRLPLKKESYAVQDPSPRVRTTVKLEKFSGKLQAAEFAHQENQAHQRHTTKQQGSISGL